MTIALLLLLSYILGSIPFALIVGKWFYGIDIREHGSGNLGGTNTFRTLGKKAGFIVTTGDVLKGTLSTLLPVLILQEPGYLQLLCGFAAVIGHVYPLFAKFKGGKAVATSAGIILGYNPLVFLVLAVIFFSALFIWRYVSLASMLTGILGTIIVMFTKDIPLIMILGALTIFIIYRHIPNIERIKNRTEPKIGLSKKK